MPLSLSFTFLLSLPLSLSPGNIYQYPQKRATVLIILFVSITLTLISLLCTYPYGFSHEIYLETSNFPIPFLRICIPNLLHTVLSDTGLSERVVTLAEVKDFLISILDPETEWETFWTFIFYKSVLTHLYNCEVIALKSNF